MGPSAPLTKKEARAKVMRAVFFGISKDNDTTKNFTELERGRLRFYRRRNFRGSDKVFNGRGARALRRRYEISQVANALGRIDPDDMDIEAARWLKSRYAKYRDTMSQQDLKRATSHRTFHQLREQYLDGTYLRMCKIAGCLSATEATNVARANAKHAAKARARVIAAQKAQARTPRARAPVKYTRNDIATVIDFLDGEDETLSLDESQLVDDFREHQDTRRPFKLGGPRLNIIDKLIARMRAAVAAYWTSGKAGTIHYVRSRKNCTRRVGARLGARMGKPRGKGERRPGVVCDRG